MMSDDSTKKWTTTGTVKAVLLTGVVLFVAARAAPYFLGSDSNELPLESPAPTPTIQEQVLEGHAMLRRSVDIKWSEQARHYYNGDVVQVGLVGFDQGVAEFDSFCGATLIAAGPASLDFESDWTVKISSGSVRVRVPAAAKGFVIKAAGSEIVALGSEFIVQAEPNSARVKVIDGDVELRGGKHDGDKLASGEQRWFGEHELPDDFESIGDADELVSRHESANAKRFAEWQEASKQLREDDRLIAYFPIAEMEQERELPNVAIAEDTRDGILIGPVQHNIGRFGEKSHGLEFERIGARVRTRIDGEFSAFTFATWVRIDNLDHVYNALFLADGYENGEPHWQIRDDGRLMFSVMVDDSQKNEYRARQGGEMVRDAGKHRVYVTERIWDSSQSGQWLHLVAVYNPEARQVNQYVNGRLVSGQRITDEYFIDKLRIGTAEIGNWGQPFRDSSWFSVRNLNGTMDELAIFNAAISADEVKALYDSGKPLGY